MLHAVSTLAATHGAEQQPAAPSDVCSPDEAVKHKQERAENTVLSKKKTMLKCVEAALPATGCESAPCCKEKDVVLLKESASIFSAQLSVIAERFQREKQRPSRGRRAFLHADRVPEGSVNGRLWAPA